MRNLIIISLLVFLSSSCEEVRSPDSPDERSLSGISLPEGFGDYWYQGKAELSSYNLEQVRYGSVHDGVAVLIFVTEPFSKSSQVKKDYADGGEDEITVLKINKTKSFNTGLYPYQLMNSTFSPVEIGQYPHALKSATTVQEWCGHVYSQYNLRDAGYQWRSFSYFGSEGEQQSSLGMVWLEDGIWNQIRLNPKLLPTGSFRMVPSSFFNRLKHQEVKGREATASLKKDGELSTYNLNYPALNRSLTVRFNSKFPFEIESWEERYPEGGRMMTTRATLNKRINKAYWNYNRPEDEALREELGL
jgi:hypothetical protein